jgi:signal transduction histidine kinase
VSGLRHPGSLRRRLLLASLALTLVALVAAGVAIGFILHRFVRGQVEGRLDERVLSLASDLETGDRLALRRELEAPPFDRPRGGWYWQVRRGDEVLRSASLRERDLALSERPRGTSEPGRIRPAEVEGPWGDSLLARVLVLSGEPSVTILATAPAAALRGPVLEALGTLALCLGLLGAFLAAGAGLQVGLGLRPLARLRGELAAVRAGRAARLAGGHPDEVRPLVEEMNALIDQNAANLEAARAHVANLAHGLKTPLATLSLALANRGEAEGALAGLVVAMDRRVQHHLRRARSAAGAGPARARVSVAAHLEDLRAVMLRLHAGKAPALTLDVPADLGVACDPQDLDEMLGNVVENACRWCRSAVRISAAAMGQEVHVVVEDDGPGLDPEQIEAVLQRGRRLDESTPGHGFGLPIATELAGLYGGRLALARADLGGLKVVLVLPA